MAYNWQKFEGRNKKIDDRITVTKSAGIGLPKKFYDDNGVENMKSVILYWDADSKTIGIKFSSEGSDKSNFKILKSSHGYGGHIGAKSFFKSYGIDTHKFNGRYVWQKHEEPGIGELFAVTLKEHES